MAKMTVKCKDCQHEFGAWRDRCPACGTHNQVPADPVFNAPRVKKEKRPRERRPDECIFCWSRVKPKQKASCPSCNELIHKRCLSLHEDPCKMFVAQINCKHKFEEQPGEPPVDVCVHCGMEER